MRTKRTARKSDQVPAVKKPKGLPAEKHSDTSTEAYITCIEVAVAKLHATEGLPVGFTTEKKLFEHLVDLFVELSEHCNQRRCTKDELWYACEHLTIPLLLNQCEEKVLKPFRSRSGRY